MLNGGEVMSSNKGYYLIDLERSIKSGRVFYWKPANRGYTPSLEEAGVYSEEESQKQIDKDFNKRTVRTSTETVKDILKL